MENHQKIVCRKRIDSYLTDRSKPDQKNRSEVLEQLLDLNEALTLLTPGNDTTADAIIIGAYLICTHPKVLKGMVEELHDAFPEGDESITFDQAKQLPYLTAVLREVLRCSNSLPGCLPRVVPPEGASIDGIDLAAGTIVHTSAYLLNRHKSAWGEDSWVFKPERWLIEQPGTLDKFMTSLYKGS
ncbi:MAG: hypothetical protein Q9209_007740 [Squamulea sp. 1 TL-2023]